MDRDLNVIPAAYLNRLLVACEKLGESIPALLDGTSLSKDDIQRPGLYINHAQQMQVFTNIANLPISFEASLLSCKEYDVHSFGLYGLVVQTSKDLREAVRCATRYVPIVGGYADTASLITDKKISIVATENFPLVAAQHLVIDEVICGFHVVINQLLEKPIQPQLVSFEYAAPKAAKRYAEFFGCPVEFSASKSEIRYACSAGDLPIKYYDPFAHETCVQRCEQMLLSFQQAETTEDKVRKILFQLSNRQRTAEHAAERLHTSPRNLRRKLSQEGTSFQRVLDNLRHELAKSYLIESRLSIDQIASLIGFSETNNFRRAFKKWHGSSPTECRNQLN